MTYLLASAILIVLSSLIAAPKNLLITYDHGSRPRTAISQAPNANQAKRSSQILMPQTLKARLTLPLEQDQIDSVAASSDGRLVVTAVTRLRRSLARRVFGLFSSWDDQFRSDSVLKIWDGKTGELKRVIRDVSVGYFETMVFSPDARTLLTSDDSRVKLWDAQSGKLLFNGRGYPSGFNPDGGTLALTDRPMGKQCRAELVDVPTGTVRATMNIGTKPTREWNNFCSLRIYFSNDNQRLITASSDRDSELWELRTGRRLAVLSGTDDANYSYWDGATEMFSPDGKIAVTIEAKFNYPLVARTLKVWDPSTGELLRSIDGAAEPVRFSPDGKVLATAVNKGSEQGPDASISLWDVATGKLIKTFREPKAGANDIVWSPDARTIAAAGDELRLWDVDTGKLKATLPVVVDWEFNFVGTVGNWDHLFFSPDSRFLIAANKKSTRIIDAKTGNLLEKIDKLRLPGSFTPDGCWVARTIDRKSAAVWEILPS
jgi:WD40 repeat protein